MSLASAFKNATKELGLDGQQNVGFEEAMQKLKKKFSGLKLPELNLEETNPELAAKGGEFMEQAKTTIHAIGESWDKVVEENPALKQARDWMQNGIETAKSSLKNLFSMETSEASAAGVVAGIGAGGLVGIGKEEVMRPDQMGISEDVGAPSERIEGKTVKYQEIAASLSNEEKAVLMDFSVDMFGRMMDMAKQGKEYGLSDETINQAIKDMSKNAMSQMTPEQMQTMMNITGKVTSSGLLTDSSTMTEMREAIGGVMSAAIDDEEFGKRVMEIAAEKGTESQLDSVYTVLVEHQKNLGLTPEISLDEFLKKLKEKTKDPTMADKRVAEAESLVPEVHGGGGLEIPELQ